MSKIIFMKYFITFQAQIGLKIKNAEDLLKFGTSGILSVPISISMSKITFMKYLPPVRPKLVYEFIEIWHMRYLKHNNFDINAENDFYEIFRNCQSQISPKIKNAQNLSKFGTFDISNIPISVFMSKMVFIKYLPPVRPKLVLELKVFGIY